MRRGLVIGLLTGVLLPMATPRARAVDRKRVDEAIEQGVTALRSMQRADGTWPHPEIGATALAALTLLECGAKPDDLPIKRAADAVRSGSTSLRKTYSLSLCILFLDRLDDPEDIPLIESMAVRLLAGQNNSGGWDYSCPPIPDKETRRLNDVARRQTELVGRRNLNLPPKGKRTLEHLSPEIRQQLRDLGRGERGPQPGNVPQMAFSGDNSNTQFAILALWVARRHGLPVDDALTQAGQRFRTSQNIDGGWSYTVGLHLPGMPPGTTTSPSMASMTCAGALGLVLAHGVAARGADLRKDRSLEGALLALGSVIGNPVGDKGEVPQIGGRAYYFLWSLERLALSLNLDRIGKKDWYGWGVEVLLANQQTDGTWRGAFWESGADTCFALLFLRKANLVADLSSKFKDRYGDPGERVLRGGVGLGGTARKMKPALDPKGTVVKHDQNPSAPARLPRNPDTDPRDPPARSAPTDDSESARLAGSLVKASEEEQGILLGKLRDSKGSQYTDALAVAIPQMKGEAKTRVRDALAARLARMTAKTLTGYLQDDDAEIRRAAALACAMKETKEHIPVLIRLLGDPEPAVERAAHAALKALTDQDFGPAPNATRAERAQAIANWQVWWSKKDR